MSGEITRATDSRALALDQRIDRLIEQSGSCLDQARVFLLEVRDGQLWKQLENPTTERPWRSFSEYATTKFQRSKSHINRHLQAAAALTPLGVNSTLPERHLRPLGALAPASRQAVGQQLWGNGARPSLQEIDRACLANMSEDQQKAFVQAADARSRAASERTDRAAEMVHLEKCLTGWPGVIRHMEQALAGAVRINNHANRVRLALRNLKRWQRLACEEIADTLAACEGRRVA